MDEICRRNDVRWYELCQDIFLLIVNKEQLSLADIVRMTVVCKPWRSTIIQNIWSDLHINSNVGKTSLPWLMLAENSSNDENIDKRGFFNSATGGVTEVYLPEASGRRCCGSSHGWIVTMGQDLDINILNPLTREQLTLPSDEFNDGTNDGILYQTYPKIHIFHTFMKKAILTCNPNCKTLECMVVSFFTPLCGFYVLACAKLGDSAWTILPPVWEEGDERSDASDFIFYKGQLYGISIFGELIVMNLYQEQEWKVISPPLFLRCEQMFSSGYFKFYLAEISGTFIAVARHKKREENDSYHTLGVLVFKFFEQEWCQIDNIGDCCLCLGTNQTISLSPVPRGFCANCIYFTDDEFNFRFDNFRQLTGHDMVVYSMDSDDFSPFFQGVSLSPFSPPLWVTLSST